MTHVKALQAGHSNQGTSEPITTGCIQLQLTVSDKGFGCYLDFGLRFGKSRAPESTTIYHDM